MSSQLLITIGLILDILGVCILFRFGLPGAMRKNMIFAKNIDLVDSIDELTPEEIKEDERQTIREERWAVKSGIGHSPALLCLVIGFGLQIIGAWTTTAVVAEELDTSYSHPDRALERLESTNRDRPSTPDRVGEDRDRQQSNDRLGEQGSPDVTGEQSGPRPPELESGRVEPLYVIPQSTVRKRPRHSMWRMCPDRSDTESDRRYQPSG